MQAYSPHGLNVGINLESRLAPASSITCTCTSFRAGTGTRNFMTVVGTTRVLPEELPESAARSDRSRGAR